MGLKKSLFQRIFMQVPELEEYYRELRKYQFKHGKKLKHIRFREFMYPVFVKCVALDRIFHKQSLTVLGNQKKYKKPIIYACTHIGGGDCERLFEAIQRGCWWFVGDPGKLYKEISGLLLHLNGCIMLDTGDKDDRHIAYLRAVELLQNGGSLMIFPEGARNGTYNLPVMQLFPGTAQMAMETHTSIVPMAIEHYDNRFVVNIGQEICPDIFDNVIALSQELRDTLATLKWEIWNREELVSRRSLADDYRELFTREFARSIYPNDTLEAVERTRFHTKIPSPKEAFAYLDMLVPSKENAFLQRNKNNRGISLHLED